MTEQEKKEVGKKLKTQADSILVDIFDNYHLYNVTDVKKVNDMCQLMSDLNKDLEHYDLELITNTAKAEKLTIKKAKKRSIWVAIFGGRP